MIPDSQDFSTEIPPSMLRRVEFDDSTDEPLTVVEFVPYVESDEDDW